MRNIYRVHVNTKERMVRPVFRTNLKTAIGIARRFELLPGEEISVTTNEGKLFEPARVCYSRKYQPFEKKRGKQS